MSLRLILLFREVFGLLCLMTARWNALLCSCRSRACGRLSRVLAPMQDEGSDAATRRFTKLSRGNGISAYCLTIGLESPART